MKWISDSTIRHLRKIADWPDLSGTRYEIDGLLGQGGMGTVYLVTDRELRRQVALKVLRDVRSDTDSTERMLREARVIANLEHPGVVPVHDVGRLRDGRVYYVMKRIRGKRLDEHFGEAASLADRLRVFERVCETTAFAHAHGVIHRDLKPQNVMVGEFGEVLVLDWGVAKWRAEARTQDITDGLMAKDAAFPRVGRDGTATPSTARGTIIGTPAYMSPEQARGETDQVTERSDIFSLGAILYFLLTKRAPRGHDSAGGFEEGGSTPVDSPRRIDRAIPKPLDALCLKALNPQPDRRYPSVNELAADVARFLSGQAVSAYREGPLERLWRLARIYRTPILLVAAYLLMRILLFLWSRP